MDHTVGAPVRIPFKDDAAISVLRVDRRDESRQARDAAKASCLNAWQNQFAPNPIVGCSFSHVPGATWGVASCASDSIGIDAACDSEFLPNYPFQKVFSSEELCLAPPACLWAIKEAVVKARGCGWEGKNPLDVRISREMQVEGFAVEVRRQGVYWVAVVWASANQAKNID